MDRIKRIFGRKGHEGLPNGGPDEEYVRSLADTALNREDPSDSQPNKLSGSMGEVEDLIRDNTLTIDQKRLAAKKLHEEMTERLRRESTKMGTYSSELNYWDYEYAIEMLEMFLGTAPIREEYHWIKEYM